MPYISKTKQNLAKKDRPLFDTLEETLRVRHYMNLTLVKMLRNLHWLPVHYRIVFKMLLLTYKALNGLAPDYIKDLLRYYDSRRALRSSNDRLLDEPRANLKTYGERAFSVMTPNALE